VSIANGTGLGVVCLLLPGGLTALVDILVIIVIIVTVILSGRWLTYLFIAVQCGIVLTGSQPISLTTTAAWMHVLGIPMVGVVLTETVLRLGQAIRAKVQRLETVNRLSRTIAMTIEVDQVISMVSAAVQQAIQADTYYVGIAQGEMLRLDLFYDDGVFFPRQEIPIKGGLAGWVIENRKPLLTGNVRKEIERLGMELRVIGKPKVSQSWLGAPMIAGNQLIGIMAMASYRPNAFDEADLELLENMAHQSALVIDNAYHHAEVTRQSQLDSLTQVFNHGQFLANLEALTRQARLDQTPLSLIMLDVDYFKQFNDTYGHLVGDEALNQVVAAVRHNIRSRDVVGRWGGEEFAIILPDTDGIQATQVANRIQQTLRTLNVLTVDGLLVPPPTVSQGIAMLTETTDAVKLVDLSDQRLYIAKDRGRDQIEPESSHWENLTR
jgi:diguanylate cyclase (GGDEF)-like protein